jgi:hypothetical protein
VGRSAHPFSWRHFKWARFPGRFGGLQRPSISGLM